MSSTRKKKQLWPMFISMLTFLALLKYLRNSFLFLQIPPFYPFSALLVHGLQCYSIPPKSISLYVFIMSFSASKIWPHSCLTSSVELSTKTMVKAVLYIDRNLKYTPEIVFHLRDLPMIQSFVSTNCWA